MARPLKVWGAHSYVGRGPVHAALVARGLPEHVVQCRIIVSAPSEAAAMRAMGLTRSEWQHSGCETGNAVEVALGLAQPGQVFVASLDYGRNDPDGYVPVTADAHGNVTLNP